nr:hypothetical protein HUO10_006571 [Paraburkholderia busanensis]
MHEPVAVRFTDNFATFARWSGIVDTFCGAVAGFALLAGPRPFAFTALLAWREPVLGGMGLVLLAALGWLRWQFDTLANAAKNAEANPAANSAANPESNPAFNPAFNPVTPRVACYNRSLESESAGESAVHVAVAVTQHVRTRCPTVSADPSARRPLCVTRTTRPHPALNRQSNFKERSC